MDLAQLTASLPLGFLSVDSLDTTTVKAIVISIFVFVLVVLMAMGRHFLISSSLEGVWAGFVLGVIAIGLIEGGIFWGARKLSLGDKLQFLPRNVQLVLTDGQQNFNQVLGLKTEKDPPSAQSVVSDYSVLSGLDSDLVKNSICKIQ